MPLALARRTFTLRGRRLLPIIQGGMGVGISAHRLAGTVAGCGAVGTIASVDLRHHHPDLVARTAGTRDRRAIDATNLEALAREIVAAKALAAGEGVIAVNVMRAVSAWADYVREACRCGADAIVMGAGLPLDLPELVADHPDVALVPILSDVRGIAVVVKRWHRRGRLPDAIVIEHPGHAGGHLGAGRIEDLHDRRFEFAEVVPETLKFFDEFGIARGRIPLVVAGGINTAAKMQAALALGASAVQVGTPFAVTVEGDAHPEFKRVLAEAQPEDIVEFMSVAGLPARAVRTPWLERYLRHVTRLQATCGKVERRCVMGFDCLVQCGLRDSLAKVGQFCIDSHLVAALKGDLRRGLFFRGAEALPFGRSIRPVRDLLEYFLAPAAPVIDPIAAG